MKLEFSQYIFQKFSNIKFHGNPSGESRVVPGGQSDMTKLSRFRNFAKAPKKFHSLHRKCIQVLDYHKKSDYFPKQQ